MLINSQVKISSRESTYLIKSRTGIYTFRWNIRTNGKHRQPRMSLRTRNHLEAIKHASILATKILSIKNPTVNEVKKIYDNYSGKAVNKILISSLDLLSTLSELSASSRNEYMSGYRDFLKVIEGEKLGKEDIKQEHIEAYKAKQTCGDVTMKKKLRLLGACFKRLGILFETEWMQIVIKGKSSKSKKRAYLNLKPLTY